VIFETLLVGMLLALLFAELTDLYPGGIIVPAYLALYLTSLSMVAATLGVAVLSLGTYRLLSRRLILFGRRRFVLIILLGIVWGQLASLLLPLITPESQMRVIGWIIPGLLANNLERQRFLPTLAGLAAVSILTYFVVKLAAVLL
jgi:poly-gamma-glutamate biosynthesis protein PgsC/CapC